MFVNFMFYLCWRVTRVEWISSAHVFKTLYFVQLWPLPLLLSTTRNGEPPDGRGRPSGAQYAQPGTRSPAPNHPAQKKKKRQEPASPPKSYPLRSPNQTSATAADCDLPGLRCRRRSLRHSSLPDRLRGQVHAAPSCRPLQVRSGS